MSTPGQSLLGAAAGVLLFAAAAPAQVGSGALTGVVRDQTGAGIPGVTVAITAIETNLQRVTVSTADGVYAAASLPPGNYRVDIELAGFKPITRDGIHVTTGTVIRIDFDMTLGTVMERLIVTADAPAPRGESASLGDVMRRERIEQLPLNGRTFITLASLAPGVTLPPGSQLPRINGGRPRTNAYLFDGISPAAGAGPGRLLPRRRRDRRVQDREQQRPCRIRPLQRRRHQPDDEGRHQRPAWRRVRVPAPRGAEHPQLLPAGAGAQARIPAQPVRRHARRSARPRPHLLLRRLPGTAPRDRPHRHFDRADAAAAAGHLHRGNRGARAGDLRPGDNRTRHDGAHARRSPATRFPPAAWIRSRQRCSSGTRCRPPPAR